jgi:diacylglycerol kinase family enzyme
MARNVQIVVTPGSGEGRARKTARRMAALLDRRGDRHAVHTFHDLARLTEWARTCGPGFSHLVCVGGDATLSAAALASLRLGVPFVPVPNGFGNVFARVFRHPDRAEAVLDLLDDGEVRRVDVGFAGDEPFLSHRSYGFLEEVQQAVERGRRQPRHRLLRHLAYYRVAQEVLSRVPSSPIRVEVDGKLVARDAMLLTVANVETYRGFLSLDYGARIWVEILRHEALRLPMELVTLLGANWGVIGLILVGSLVLWRFNRRWAVLLPVLMAGTGALQFVAKWAADRPRPNLAPWGFPSGHVLSLVVFFGLMIYLIATASRRRRRWRILASLACTLPVAAVAFSRLYLDVHWLSDLAGGLMIGVAYLLLAIWVVEVVSVPASAEPEGDAAPAPPPRAESG